MKKLILISALLFNVNGWADEDVFGLDCNYDEYTEKKDEWTHNYFVLDIKNETVSVWDAFDLVFEQNELDVAPTSVSWGVGTRLYYIGRSSLNYRYHNSNPVNPYTSDWQQCKMVSVEKIYELANQHRKEETKDNKF